MFVQGCSLDDIKLKPVLPQGQTHKVHIYSEIRQQPATKVAVDDGFCTGDQVGVYLVNYNGQTPGTLNLKDNQADNVRFTFNENGDWVSDYDIFYMDNETNVDFYGYYPYAEPISIEAYPFEVARDQSKGVEHGQMATYEASDFLWANTKNVKPTESKVILTFRHQMSSARIRFSQGTGWDDVAEYAAVTKEVLVTNTIRKSTINLATGVVTLEGEAPLTGIVPLNDNGEFRAIVVPQTVAAGKTVLTLTIDGSPRNYVRNVDTEYVPGKITTFDLSINKKTNSGEYEVELAGVSITAWEADNISHGDDAREYVVVHNEVPGGLERTIVDRLEMDPTKIKNLKLTGNITSEDYKFMGNMMTNLQRLNLKEVESVVKGVYAIPSGWSCRKLMKCIFPDKLERIEGGFGGSSLSGSLLLPDGLKYVSGFSQTKITNVKFPNSLEEIGQSAFAHCQSLMCEIEFPESLKKIGYGAFDQSAIQGDLVFPHSLETIESYAFYGCANLTGSLEIPDKIKEIPRNTFANCMNLCGTLTLPNGLQEIGENAFLQTSLKGELNIPSTVTIIEKSAFANTLFNGTLVLPSELISLGASAFSGCWRLSGIVEIPENIISVPTSVFAGCSNLEGVTFHKDVEVIEASAFNGCYGIHRIVCAAKNPPVINSNSFNGVAKDNFTIEVPEASVNLYKTTNLWREFKRIAAYRDFSISRNLYRTLNAESTKTFVVRAPAGDEWSVENKPEWVTVEPMYGIGKVDVKVSVSALEKGSGNRSGEIQFLLDGKEYRSSMTIEQYDYQYGDGDVVTLQEASKGSGVNVVLMGDCFDAKDISEGKYLKAVRDAYGYFFDIEPYLTYKEYFNVYGVFGMSPDSGMGTVNTIRDARFGSQYSLIEKVDPNYQAVFAAACLAPIDDDVSRTLIILIENTTDYSGKCAMWGDGSAVAIVAMSTDPAPYDFRGVVHHEAGGHGFGKLADEYIHHNVFLKSCNCRCCSHMSDFNYFKSCGFFDNVSLEGGMRDVPWAHMIYDQQYSNVVDVYEGAYLHSRGVFRSEPNSCMNNNIPYYNAISREAMVKRIMKYAGEPYSFEEFKAKDYVSHPQVTTKGENLWDYEDNTVILQHLDQHPPKLMGDKPIFKKSDF